jgi:hypothetical protein
MSKHHSWTSIQRVALLAASAAILPACGGSAELSAGASGGARSVSSAGSGGNQSAGSGGDQSAGSSANQSAGSSGDQSGGSGGNQSGDSAGASDCFDTSCPANVCSKGMKLELIAGSCCGSCAPDPEACSEGQAAYVELIDQLLAAPGALSCASDADCMWVAGSAQCDQPCLPRVVNVASAPGLRQAVRQFETENCSTCSPIDSECASITHPACSDGSCVLRQND